LEPARLEIGGRKVVPGKNENTSTSQALCEKEQREKSRGGKKTTDCKKKKNVDQREKILKEEKN